MPAMMPPGKGKDKGKAVGKNAKEKAKDGRDRSGKGQMGKAAKTRVLLKTETRLEQEIAEFKAELELREKNEEEEGKKRKRIERFEKPDEEGQQALPKRVRTESESASSSSGNQNEEHHVRYARRRAMHEKQTGDTPPHFNVCWSGKHIDHHPYSRAMPDCMMIHIRAIAVIVLHQIGLCPTIS